MREREELIKACRVLAQHGLIRATEGNLSFREGEFIVITPSGARKSDLEVKDLSVIDMEGHLIEGPKPSSEYKMHLEIYRRRQDVAAVVHAHPEFAVSLAIAGISLEYPVLSEAVAFLGPVPCVEHRLPSTQELAELVGNYAGKYDALLLTNHGAVTFAPSIGLALYFMEILEFTARVFYRALTLRRVKLLSKEEVKRLMDIRISSYRLPEPKWGAEDFRWDLLDLLPQLDK